MREPRGHRRAAAALVAATAVALGVAAPAALAQEAEPPEEWARSAYTSVPDEATHESITIEGEFVRTGGLNPYVTSVEVSFGRADSEGDFDDADDDECVPDDPGIVEDGDPDDDARYPFSATADFVCNGRFAVSATGTAPSLGGRSRYTMTATFVVGVAPPPVTEVTATRAGDPAPETGATDDDPETVSITFEPLGDEQLADDAAGYRVMRYGPERDGTDSAPVVVGDDLATDDEPAATDEVTAPGTYRYVVRSMRHGHGGPVLSPLAGSGVAEVTVAGPRATTTTTRVTTPPTTSAPLALPQVGSGRSRRGAATTAPRAPRTPTSADSGFSETLDYGERQAAEPGDDELAGEGQSIIRSEQPAAGLAIPVAGAMVLLGWAGHVAYLNRLAKQF